MEKYKINVYSKDGIGVVEEKETEIPNILVQAIAEALKNIEFPADEGETLGYVTPIMINPNLKEVSFGVLSREGYGPAVFKYHVSIRTKEYWDDIHERLHR